MNLLPSRKDMGLGVDEESGVVNYLRTHPDFFAVHPDLLTDLSVQHPTSGGTVSLIERQVAVLREQNGEMKRQMRELVHIAQDNDRTSERLHRLTLALLDARHFGAVVLALHDSLCNDFHADTVALLLVGQTLIDAGNIATMCSDHGVDVRFTTLDSPAMNSLRATFNRGKPACGQLKPSQMQALFEERAPALGSAVIIPLTAPTGGRKALGLLGVGSFDGERFHATQGTLFLTRISELVTHALKPYLISSVASALSADS